MARPTKKRPQVGSSIPIAAGQSLLRPLKAAEVVARELVRDISANGLAPGDSLESEAEMLKKYGVSRESLREGLRLLEVQGMISIRRGPGGGPTVGTVDPANLGRMEALFFHLAGATYDDLFDAWVIAERTLTRLAAGNPDEALRQSMMEPYLDADAPHEEASDLEDFVEGHGGFHDAVAALSGNRVLELTFRAFGRLVAHHVATVGDPRAIGHALVADHVALAEAIRDGNAEHAEKLMEQHLRTVISINVDQLGELVEGRVEWL